VLNLEDRGTKPLKPPGDQRLRLLASHSHHGQKRPAHASQRTSPGSTGDRQPWNGIAPAPN